MNRSFRSLAVLGFCTLLAASSCRESVIVGSGPSKTEVRATSGYFNQIEIDAPVDADIQVTEGAAPSVQLSGFSNIIGQVRTEIKDSTLRFYTHDEVEVHTDKNLMAHIVMPAMAGISISGSSDVAVHGNIKGNTMDLDLSGAGSVVLQALNVIEFKADMSGASNLNIQSGVVDKATYDMSGAGKIRAYGLQTQDANVEISGAGTAEVTATQKLNADLSGVGHISYKGHPAITQDISGAGGLTDTN